MDLSKMIEEVSCPICGKSNSKKFTKYNGWTIMRCQNCKTCYTNPRPTSEALPHYYNDKYFSGDRFLNPTYNPNAIEWNKISDIESWIEKRGALLEIGAANGSFLKSMKNRGWNVYGIDISADAAVAGKKEYGIEIFCGVAKDYKPKVKFDAICLYQTFEHLPDPNSVMEQCFQWLNPGGLLVIEVPNINSFDMIYSRERKILSYDLPRHLVHFNAKTLSGALEKHGFRIINTSFYYPQFLLSITECIQSKRKQIPVAEILKDEISMPVTDQNVPMLLKPSGRKQQILNAISNFFPGWRMTITAKKPI